MSAKKTIEAQEHSSSDSFYPFTCGVLLSTLDFIAEECGIDGFKSEDIRKNIKG